MSQPNRKRGVLLLAYGTPDSPEDLPEYLLDVRRGRPFDQALLEELRHRYEAIGGRSPLTGLTQAQAAGTADELARRGREWPVYVGMRHWQPRIATALEQMRQDGVEEAIALILAPHRCFLTFDLYVRAVGEGLSQLDGVLEVRWVDGWSRQPALIQGQAEALRESLSRTSADERRQVIFSAHSLPRQRMREDDPYEEELLANAAAIAEAVGGIEWSFAWQSAGASGGEWLGPDIKEVVPRLAAEGVRQLVSMPIGFVCDHLEVLYDLDIETRALAESHGVAFERVPMMNTRPLFLRAIADALLAVEGD